MGGIARAGLIIRLLQPHHLAERERLTRILARACKNLRRKRERFAKPDKARLREHKADIILIGVSKGIAHVISHGHAVLGQVADGLFSLLRYSNSQHVRQ